MVTFLGNDPFIQEIGKSLGDFEGSSSLPMDDQSLERENPPPFLGRAGTGGPNVISDRDCFKEFCIKNEINSPNGKKAHSFEELSRAVISMNRFPLALKSCRNSSWGTTVFRLEGFRELEKFFNRIQSINQGPVWVEDWVRSLAIIEISRFRGGFELVEQVGLDKKLLARPVWRQFPVAVPAKFREMVDRIQAPFLKIFENRDILLRFSIGLTQKEAVLLSLNGGWNRLEYFPGWTEPFGLSPAVFSFAGKKHENPEKRYKYGRLQILYRGKKSPPWPEAIPKAAEFYPILKYIPANRHAAILLGGNDPDELLKYSRNLGEMFQVTEDD